jgi:rare lipoprotein A
VLALAGCTLEPAHTGATRDDGPGGPLPSNPDKIADARPRSEPLNAGANSPYSVLGRKYVPYQSLTPYRQRGIASWYGRKFHGKRTSSGERYDMYAMTAAHKTLPIPSYARVTNLANGRSVVVRVNDRGPFHAERLIDLSYAAAYRLGFTSAGSARVEVEAVSPQEAAAKPSAKAEEPAAKGVYLQIGAFGSKDNAEDLRTRVASQLSWLTDAVQVLSLGNLWRLQVGPYASSEAARAIAERIELELNLKPLVVTR